jgi:hypothetical protein
VWEADVPNVVDMKSMKGRIILLKLTRKISQHCHALAD